MTDTDFSPIFQQVAERSPLILAGPCSAESRSQTLAAAEALAAGGIHIFRAGVWKPRTRPGGFEGVGEKALEWIVEAGKITGMATVTEVANAGHLNLAVNYGINGIWLGARTTANPFAVQDIADALKDLPSESRDSLSVLVKNPVNPDIELWAGAIERLYAAGVRRLAAVHRGFSSYGASIYRNPPLWRIPIELHRRYPALPIIGDPSHIGGKRELIAPISQQALDIGFDGLMIESHCNPDVALSDARQQVTPKELLGILSELETPQNTENTVYGTDLEELRRRIDAIDDDLMDLLSRRMATAREIGAYKRNHRMAVVQPGRYRDLMESRSNCAAELGLSPDFVANLLAAIHEESVRQQLDS